MSFWLLILATGATARLVRLIGTDVITAPLRNRLYELSNGGFLYILATCAWCLGVWVAAAVLPAAYISHGAWWFVIPAAALTVSYAVGLLAAIENFFARIESLLAAIEKSKTLLPESKSNPQWQF